MRYFLMIAAGLAYGQTAPVIFSVSDPRPLAQAAQAFELRYGIPVSYEDVNYAYEGDWDDKTVPEYAKSHPGGRRALIPKGGSLTLRADPKLAVHSAADAMPLLQPLLDDHKKAGYPGEFKLIPTGDGVAIVPAAVKNASGILLPDQSILETKISLPELRRTADETFGAICAAIQTNTGKVIGLASSPFHGIQPYSVTIGASNEPARTVLERTLANLGFAEPGHVGRIGKASWSLLYGPGYGYGLSLRQVRMEVSTPAGGKIKRPVFR